MEIKHDKDADAVYIRLRDVPYHHGEDLDHERRVDFGADGSPMGVEFLCVSTGVEVHGLPCEHKIAKLLADHGIRVLSLSR